MEHLSTLDGLVTTEEVMNLISQVKTDHYEIEADTTTLSTELVCHLLYNDTMKSAKTLVIRAVKGLLDIATGVRAVQQWVSTVPLLGLGCGRTTKDVTGPEFSLLTYSFRHVAVSLFASHGKIRPESASQEPKFTDLSMICAKITQFALRLVFMQKLMSSRFGSCVLPAQLLS